jgi:hypothetical protein
MNCILFSHAAKMFGSYEQLKWIAFCSPVLFSRAVNILWTLRTKATQVDCISFCRSEKFGNSNKQN